MPVKVIDNFGQFGPILGQIFDKIQKISYKFDSEIFWDFIFGKYQKEKLILRTFLIIS